MNACDVTLLQQVSHRTNPCRSTAEVGVIATRLQGGRSRARASFGCDKTMWVAGGCRGEFGCAGLEIPCGFKGQNASKRTCSCSTEDLPRMSCERGCRFIGAAYRCGGKKYQELLASLPPVTCDGLRLRKNAHVLFFGTSSLGQVLDSILCANNITAAADMRYSAEHDDYTRYTPL